MTPDQKFSLLISGIGLLFVLLSAVLGILVRAGINWGRLTTTVENLGKSIGQIAIDVNRRLERLEDRP
jgi:hypothetical protein